MAISANLMENVVQRASVTLREKASLLKGVAMDASPDPGNKGASVSIGQHDKGEATDVTPSAGNGPSTSADSFSAKLVTLDTWKNKPVTIDADDMATHNLSYNLGQAIDNSIGSCINAVSESMHNLYTLIPYTAGTAGRSLFNNGTVASIDTLADVRTVLNTNEVPDFGQRQCIVSTTEAGNYGKVPNVQNANQMGNDMVRRTGLLGMDSGFELAYDQRIKSHTAGTITTGLIAKAATAVAAGVSSFIATTAAATGACALKTGDIISIAHASGARTYAVQADVTQAAAATDTAAITLDRGLEFALIGSEAVTIATGFGTGTQNIAGDLRGFGLLNRIPAGQLSGMTALRDATVITDPVSGLSLLMGWYGQNARTVWETSIFYGVNVVQSDLLVRAQGI
jgi:hypothetical protein